MKQKLSIILLLLTSQIFAQSNWKMYAPSTMPPQEASVEMANAGEGIAVKFGGANLSGTWEYVADEKNTGGVWSNSVVTINHDGTKAPMPRYNNALAHIGGTKAVLFGGTNGTANYNDTWIYDSSDNSWTKMNPSTHPIGSEMYPIEMAWLGPDNGGDKVLYVGTTAIDSQVAWIYDLSDDAWTEITTPLGRTHLTVVMSYFGDDQIIIVPSQNTDPAYIYDLSENTWTAIASLPVSTQDRAGEMAFIAKDSEGTKRAVFHLTSSVTYIYNSKDNTWKHNNVESWNTPRDNFGFAETSFTNTTAPAAFGGIISDNYYYTSIFNYIVVDPTPPIDWQWGAYGDDTFFMNSVWLQEANTGGQAIDQYIEIGINTYAGFWGGLTESIVTDLRAKNMHYITHWDMTSVGSPTSENVVAKAHLDDPLFLAWAQKDEPDMAQGGAGTDCQDPQISIDFYKEIKDFDKTGRPVMLNCTPGVALTNYNGRGNCAGKTEMYAEYYSAADIACFDIYPVSTKSTQMKQTDLFYVGQGVKNMRKWTENGKEAYWFALECTNMMDIGAPTPEDMFVEAWMGIINGGTGIMWFPFTVYPAQHSDKALLQDPVMMQSVKNLMSTINDNVKTIHTPTLEGVVEMKTTGIPGIVNTVDFMTKISEEKDLHIWTVGNYLGKGGTTATFTINGLDVPDGTEVEVMYEEGAEKITVTDNKFSYRYTTHEVHLFKIVGDFVLSTEDNIEITNSASLEQNYPNPVFQYTTIPYSIAKKTKVNLSVYDISGKKVLELVNKTVNPGEYKINVEASELGSGAYFYRLETETYSESKKMYVY